MNFTNFFLDRSTKCNFFISVPLVVYCILYEIFLNVLDNVTFIGVQYNTCHSHQNAEVKKFSKIQIVHVEIEFIFERRTRQIGKFQRLEEKYTFFSADRLSLYHSKKYYK